MVKIYGIKNCGSVKKALNFLDSKGIDYEFIDFKKTPLMPKNLDFWLKKVDLKTLLNTKGTTYKKLELKNKNLDNEQIKAYLLQEPLLIKRPVIEYQGGIIVGFEANLYHQIQWKE